MTEHALTGLFRVLHGNVFEGEQHKVSVLQMVRVTGVHNDAYQVIVAVTLWTSLSEGRIEFRTKLWLS